MKQLFFVFFILFCVSCNTKKEEVLDFNDLAPESENYKEGEHDIDTNLVEDNSFVSTIDADLLQKFEIANSFLKSDTLLFPDRFSPRFMQKFHYSTENGLVFYNEWSFKDSTKTMNVLFNWLNCFGSKCNSAMLAESKNLQSDGFLLLIRDTSICYIVSNNSTELNKWKKLATANDDLEYWYVLQQGKRGKVKWEGTKIENSKK